MERPPADVVSFAERARERTLQRGPADPSTSGDGAGGGSGRREGDEPAPPADLAREAMLRRLDHLARGSGGSLRSVEDELAVLVYDSARDPEPLAGIRGPAAGVSRQLTFRGPSLVLEVELDEGAGTLTCQVVPPQAASLEVRHGGGALDLGADEFGTFHAPSLPPGAISLRCVPLEGGVSTATSWISVSDRPFA